MASAQTREELRKFRFVTSHRPVPWAMVRNLNVAAHRTQAPQLDVLSRLSSEICDLNLDATNLGLLSLGNSGGGSGGTSITSGMTATTVDNSNNGNSPTATDVVQLCHSLQVSLQFSLFSQSCMMAQLRSIQQTKSVNNISSATLATMEGKLDAAQATITALKEANRSVNEELSGKHLKLAQGERDVEILKAKLQAAEDQITALKQQLSATSSERMAPPPPTGGSDKKAHQHRHSSRHGHKHHHHSHRHHHHDPADQDASNMSSTSSDIPHHKHHSKSNKPSNSGSYVDWASFASLMLTQQQQQHQAAHQHTQQQPQAGSGMTVAPPGTGGVIDGAVVGRLDRLDHVTQTQNANQSLLTEKLQELVSTQAHVGQTLSTMGQDMAARMTDLHTTTTQGLQGLREEVADVKQKQEFLQENQRMLSTKVNNQIHGGGGSLKPPLAATPTSVKNESGSFGVVRTNSLKRSSLPQLEETSFGELHQSVMSEELAANKGGPGGRGDSAAPSPLTMTCEFCQCDYPQSSFADHVVHCSKESQERQEANHQDAAGEEDDEVPYAGPPKCVHCQQLITVDNIAIEDNNTCSQKCGHCRQRYPCYEIEMHEGECDLRFIQCTECGSKVCAKLMKDHLGSAKCLNLRDGGVGTGSSVGGGTQDVQSTATGGMPGMGPVVTSIKGPGGSTINSSSSQAGGILPRKESDLEAARRELKELLAEEAAQAVEKRKASPKKAELNNSVTSNQEPMD